MRRKSDIPLRKVTLNLYKGDMEWFCGRFPRIGGSYAIRKLVRNFRRQVELSSLGATTNQVNVNIEDIDIEDRPHEHH